MIMQKLYYRDIEPQWKKGSRYGSNKEVKQQPNALLAYYKNSMDNVSENRNNNNKTKHTDPAESKGNNHLR